MRLKSMVLLLVASGCGLLAMFLFQQATQGSTSGVEQKVKILVASAEIRPGEVLNEVNVAFREYPVSVVPENAVMSKEQYEGKAITVRTFKGDFITLDKVTSDLGVSNAIPAGMVAIGIPVDATTTLSGLLGPGDRIDVFVTFTMRAAYGSGKVVKNVLEFVEVFAVDQKRQIDQEANKQTKIISLLVTPEQAALLKLAQDVGTLHVAMRSKHDSEPRTAEGDKFTTDTLNGFYGNNSSSGEEEVPREKTGDKDLDQFLDANAGNEQTPVAETTYAPLTFDTPKKTWTVEIFSGDSRRVEEVPVDEPEAEATADGTADSGRSNPFVNAVKSLFGGKRGEATDTSGDSQNGKTTTETAPRPTPAVESPAIP